MHCIYLHGFASGPSSCKADFFARKIKEFGLSVEVPDLNVPDFENLTLSSQLDLVERLIMKHKQVILLGSSMGGLIATLAALRHKNVVGLLLLAPGFGISRRWQKLWGEDAMERWHREGYLEVFHHARKAPAKLGLQFVSDAALHQSEGLLVSCPSLVLHGRQDDVVPLEESIRFHQANLQKVELKILEDDHQLLNSLDELWNHSKTFLSRICSPHD